jgi:hypothetical protein
MNVPAEMRAAITVIAACGQARHHTRIAFAKRQPGAG